MSVNPDRVTPTVGPYWVTGIQGEVKDMSAQHTGKEDKARAAIRAAKGESNAV